MTDFKDLVVWQRSRTLTATVYQLTATFPASERQGLSSPLRRACVSMAHTALGRTVGEIQRMLSGLFRYTKREGWETKARVGS